MKRRRLEHPANVDHQDLVRGRADGAAAMPPRGRCLPPRIYTRPRSRPHERAAPHTPDGWRSTGRHSSRRSLVFAYSNSFSTAVRRSWPAADGGRRPPPRSRGSSSRPGPPPKRRHCEARAAVILNSRDTDSRSSPRSRRSTVTRLRRAENRPLVTLGGRSGRPPSSRRRRRTLIVLPHLDTPPARTLSQSSVQENPRAQETTWDPPITPRLSWVKWGTPPVRQPFPTILHRRK